MFNKNQNIFVTSNNQFGGITAHTVNITPHTVNIAPQPRQLDAASAAQLEAALQKDKSISVVAIMGDQEAFGFATQIVTHLKSKGYRVDGVSQVVYSAPMVGQFIKPTGSGFEVVVGGRQI